MRRGTICTTRWSGCPCGRRWCGRRGRPRESPQPASRRASAWSGCRPECNCVGLQRAIPYHPCHVLQAGANRPRVSPPSPWRTTLARHCAQVTSEMLAGSSRPASPSRHPARSSAGGAGRGSRRADRPDRCSRPAPAIALRKRIFFRPMPGVAASSANGGPSRSRNVRPSSASGSRRSVGKAQRHSGLSRCSAYAGPRRNLRRPSKRPISAPLRRHGLAEFHQALLSRGFAR